MQPVEVDIKLFQGHCPTLLDQVATTHEPLVITRNGRPVVKVVPVQDEVSLFGALNGSIQEQDIFIPIDNEWDATRGLATRD